MRRPGVILFIMLLLIAGILFLATILVHVWTHETTDDAFIDGHVILVAPKISGRVKNINVLDNQEVKKGDVLLEIDPSDYDAVVAQKQAALEVAQAKEKSAEAAVNESNASVESLKAGVQSLLASQEVTRLSAVLSHSDYTREQSLAKTGVVSAQDIEHSKSAADTADKNLESKQKEVAAAMAYIGYAEAQSASSEAQKTAAEADVNQAQAELDQAKLQQSYTAVTAPEDGRVTSKSVETGDYVQVGQALLSIVPREVWVTANYKETQITYMKPGQEALVEVDAYPGRKLKARVDSIQRGSGARFSLLPPENATGNFVKVVQRVPVKIVFDEAPEVQQVLGPGMSAVPDVKVRGGGEVILIVGIFTIAAILVVIVLGFIWLGKIRREP
ncbi:MAG TPA: HlyD family secretion protein [Chthoniobacteraceae bacterium]|nr:HlyD family secretion protein [Chthoniobacteraceae bacterium]